VQRTLTIILLVALVLRLGWAVSRPMDDAALAALPDQREYLECARNLLEHRELKFVDERFHDEVYAFRTPGYPFFLAACGGSPRIARAAQAIIDTSTVLAAFILARRWLPEWGSLAAAALVALNPFLIYFTGLLLTETLFTAMLAWGMVLLVTRNGRWWVLGGLVLCLSILVRPGAVGLPVVLGLIAAFVNRNQGLPYQENEQAVKRRWPLPVGATMVLLSLLVLTPWAFRNYRVIGRWVWSSTNNGFTAYDGFNPDASGASNQSFVKSMPQLRQMKEWERSEYLSDRAAAFVRENPRRATELAVIKLARTWSPQPLSASFSKPLYIAIGWLFTVPVYLLVLVGICYGTLPRMTKLFLLIPAIYLSIGAMLSVGSLRYRIPAEVPMAVLAASALVKVSHMWNEQVGWRRAGDAEAV
jgi:4-amino-4-deoxy-L-arabinose transferase-like glycosyltransferase